MPPSGNNGGGGNGGNGGGGGQDSDTSAPPPPDHRSGRPTRHNSSYNAASAAANANGNGDNYRPRRRGYSYPDNGAVSSRRDRDRDDYEPKRASSGPGGSGRVTIVISVFRGSNRGFESVPVTFDRFRSTDTELWEDIRSAYRNDLQGVWRRLLLFKTMRVIAPIEFSKNDVPKRTNPQNVPGEHEFKHAYHHPQRLRTTHDWIDWFVACRQDPDRTYGLEFVEGLWADKLLFVVVAFTVASIVVSVVWCLRGGNLQTVFTVMGFVFTGVAAEIAFIALYYQVTLPG